MAKNDARRADHLKYSLAQATSIIAAWTWFLILAAKSAELVLVASVLYASVKSSTFPAGRYGAASLPYIRFHDLAIVL